MTPEARLDRLERIVRLFVKAGLLHRRESRELQRHTEAALADQDERIDNLIKLQKHNEVRFTRLAESQINSDRRLDTLIEIVKDDRKEKSRSRI
jgi:hypothetical protein